MKKILVLALTLTGWAGVAWSQEKAPADAVKVESVLPELDGNTLSDILGQSRRQAFEAAMQGVLKDSQKDEFWKIFEQYAQERSALLEESIKVHNEYVRRKETLDSKQAMALIRRTQKGELKVIKLRDKYTDLIDKKIDGIVAARFFQAHEMLASLGKLGLVSALVGDRTPKK